MDLVLNRNSGGSFGPRRARDFCFPASSCTAAPTNKCRMDENGSFMRLFFIWRARLAMWQMCTHAWIKAAKLLFFCIVSQVMEETDRHLYSTKRTKHCTSKHFNASAFLKKKKFLVFQGNREVSIMHKLNRGLSSHTHFPNTCSSMYCSLSLLLHQVSLWENY